MSEEGEEEIDNYDPFDFASEGRIESGPESDHEDSDQIMT
jgi:hypothetical protein